MKKIGVLLLVVCSLVLFGCTKKVATEGTIELGKTQNIEQEKVIPINGTNDTFIITKKVKWENPDTKKGEHSDFAIIIPYKFTINGKEYTGEYTLSTISEGKASDSNPKYNLKVNNLDKDGNISITISKK